MILLKSPAEISQMRVACGVTANILAELREFIKAGASTWDLDNFAAERCRYYKVVPAFKGYQGFPGHLCVSINSEVVHGIPSKSKILKDGDIVGIDFGVISDGFYGDSAVTIGVGVINKSAQELIDATHECLKRGIAEARVGNRLFDISYAIQNYVEERGFSVVREFVGHGIGRSLHEEPQVPNFGPKGKGIPLREGMVLAIEPMINAGKSAVRVEADGWTAVTVDGSLSAHFEHTVAITAEGPQILTVPIQI